MKVAFLFPGQGSQKPGLLNELPDGNAVKEVLKEASETLNENVYNHHSKEALCSTKSVQISLLTAGIAGFKALEADGIMPDFVAGHSVGGFSAAVAAGVIEFKDALKIVRLRAELMERAYPQGYGMGVVIGMASDTLHSLVSQYFDEKFPVFVSNKNAPDQITLSGALSGIKIILNEAKVNGARSASLLNVSTPSHCPLLSSVSQELGEALDDIPFHRPLIPYVSNRGARLLFKPDDIRQDLAESISSPVQWHDASTVLYENGTRLFLEMPPGNVLSRLAAKGFPEARAMSISEYGYDDCLFIVKREKSKK
ncbi:malonate decarboxylase subunit epsilon [Peribacillus simplex]|uniref:malonate decarboxylase subunit epsilon n=1 Tax=Peribacillus simplex TaxID=1478 RepID=UPI0024C0F7C3|nr:malonate decarboxylase subunit epsilon [Peribacillus simplex]WHZ00094.1 malonate decarboxylase subunit epsilon [Peribacillus simplex]